MLNALKALFEKVDSAHDDHDCPPEATARVKEAIQEHIGAVHSEQLNSAIDDVTALKTAEIDRLQGVFQQIADMLSGADGKPSNKDVEAACKLARDNAPKQAAEGAEEEKVA